MSGWLGWTQLSRGISANKLAKQYAVHPSTITRIKQNQNKIKEFVFKTEIDVGFRKTLKSPELPKMEQALYKWFCYQRAQNVTISTAILCKKTLKLILSVRNIMAYVMRFLNNLKPKTTKQIGKLTTIEHDAGVKTIVKIMQISKFTQERNLMIQKKPLNRKWHLNSLSVFLDDNNLIRVGGRLHHASLSYSTKYPLLLPSTHPFIIIILQHFHLSHLHAGPQALLAAVRQQFWPINGRRLSQKVFQNCVRCSRIQPRELSQIMGNLPYERITAAPPFYNTGVIRLYIYIL